MKKEYVNPAIEVMRMETVNMLAESLGKNSTDKVNDSDKPSFLGRGSGSNDFWDDDEE
ncbi:MAG: hypothetical protein IJ243_05130 [Prevotella sp.]|nr:hypothetical protein [Prevotella sp.]